MYFYPRSPYGERRESQPLCGHPTKDFYPRSPYGERPPNTLRHCTTYLFLSTLSLRRATIVSGAGNNTIRISIHALLTESDGHQSSGNSIDTYFYPRSPYGERRHKKHLISQAEHISIHALLTESDYRAPPNNLMIQHFYPRSPYGERLRLYRRIIKSTYFYPRSPYGERRLVGMGRMNNHVISIHALLTESDPIPCDRR